MVSLLSTSGETQVNAEASGLIWRLGSDLSIIAYKKKPTPVCEFLKFLATDHGLASVDIENHVVTPKYHAIAAAWDFCLAILFLFWCVFRRAGRV